MSVSNTPECFDTFAGRKLLGTVRNLAAPAHPQDTGYSLLIFDDGRGLAISVLSSYWVVSQDEVLMLLASKVEKL